MINQIKHAGQLLKQGKLVAFPTETVYGLGADATNDIAVQKVFAAKRRPADHPLIVHISDAGKMHLWAQNIPDVAFNIAKYAWPGPVTLVLEKKPSVSNLITGGQDTIALRVPQHPVALSLLRDFDGLVGPSANAHCHISPTRAEHVSSSLGNSVDYILDGGACQIGIESTILLCKNSNDLRILRSGMISANEISRWLGYNIIDDKKLSSEVKVPGNLKKHYAPRSKTFIYNELIKEEFASERVGFLCHDPDNYEIPPSWSILKMPNDVNEYAHHLYQTLYIADNSEFSAIIISPPPTDSIWHPINDKVMRATSSHYKTI